MRPKVPPAGEPLLYRARSARRRAKATRGRAFAIQLDAEAGRLRNEATRRRCGWVDAVSRRSRPRPGGI